MSRGALASGARERGRRTPFVVRYRPLLRYPARQWPGLAVIAIVMAGAAAMAALQPLPLKVLVDNGLNGAPLTGFPKTLFDAFGVAPTPRHVVIAAAIATLVVTLVYSSLTAASGVLWEVVGQRMVRDVTRVVYGKQLALPHRIYTTTPTGDLLSRMNYDTQSVYAAASGVLIGPWINVATIAIVAFSAWRLDHELTIVLLLVAPALAAMSWYFGPRLRARARLEHDARSDVVSFVSQVMHALPVVQAFTAEQRTMNTFRSLSGTAVSTVRRSAILASIAEAFGQMLSVLGTALVLVIGGHSVLEGDMSLGALLVFVAYARTLETQWTGLLSTHRKLRAAEGGLDRVMEILDAPEDVRESRHPVSLPTRRGAARVALDRVTFGYEANRPVLTDVTLTAEPGEAIALVGRTGAGKSTLVSLVPRFFDPWTGTVTIDGIDIRDARIHDVRQRVSVVRQDPLLLPVSIADNIAYGQPDGWMPRCEIERAAEAALAAEFIDALPDGYDTVIGEWGTTLSGGQRQRLAIARAFLKNAPILILDEPTSALDAESETLLLQAVERLRAHGTVLVIAHRLSTIRRADRIVVLDHGRITEQGTHHELLTHQGDYANLHDLQFSGSAT